MQDTQSRRSCSDSESQRRPDRRSAPRRGSPRSSDGESAGSAGRVHPTEVQTPDGDPAYIKPIHLTASPPERALYEEAYRAAWEYPHDLMQIMAGVRKGLKRGKEAALRAGGSQDG